MPDDTTMTGSQPSALAAVETVAFAVVGAAVELHRWVPRAVASRRASWDQQVVLARFLGQMVVNQAQQELRRRMSSAVAGAGRSATATSPAHEQTGVEAAGVVADRVVGVPTREQLPIEHYDELSASQVIDRLAHLDAEELDTVHAYELAHRRRRTVIGRVEQLRRSTPL